MARQFSRHYYFLTSLHIVVATVTFGIASCPHKLANIRRFLNTEHMIIVGRVNGELRQQELKKFFLEKYGGPASLWVDGYKIKRFEDSTALGTSWGSLEESDRAPALLSLEAVDLSEAQQTFGKDRKDAANGFGEQAQTEGRQLMSALRH
jgi:hypothetical protein